jgi:TRAP transporter TAXI family solute receptor
MSARRRWIGAAVLSLSVALLSAAPEAAAQAGKKVRLVFTATPSNTSQYLWAAQHMKLVAAGTGFDITVQESGGTEENMYRMEKQKTAQIGIMDPVLIEKKLGKNHGIRHVVNYSPAVWQIFVAKDANVKSLRELAGKKFNPGPTGGGSTGITIGILEALGIKPAFVEATLNDALEMYSDRQIIGLSYRGTGANPTSGVVEAHAARPVTFVPFSDEEIAVAKRKYPFLGKSFIAANTYPQQEKPVPTIASWQGQVGAMKDLPADVVYAFLKAYFNAQAEVAKTHKSLGLVTIENSASEAMLPFHPGAVRFYREKGAKMPEHLIPAEAK